jgi:hypothetical protein
MERLQKSAGDSAGSPNGPETACRRRRALLILTKRFEADKFPATSKRYRKGAMPNLPANAEVVESGRHAILRG